MKSRTTKSLALAGVLALSLSGCSMLAPVATDDKYNPSDGVGVYNTSVGVRNLLLVAGEAGGPYNVVFTATNMTEETAHLDITFVDADGNEHVTHFDVDPGTTLFGDPAGDEELAVLDLGEQEIGSTVQAFVKTVEGRVDELPVPVLDGTLEEYKSYVVAEFPAELEADHDH